MPDNPERWVAITNVATRIKAKHVRDVGMGLAAYPDIAERAGEGLGQEK